MSLSFHIWHYSHKLIKKAEVRNPNQINRIRSSLYGEWKWRVISEEAILVVVDWMQNWMRSHCFYCMDPGIVTSTYNIPAFYFVEGTHHRLNALIECDNSYCNWSSNRFRVSYLSVFSREDFILFVLNLTFAYSRVIINCFDVIESDLTVNTTTYL